ncbi:hypothetical protein PG988_012014 [Apiospora saccharicola]
MAMRSSSWEIFNYLTTHNVEFHGLANVEPWNSTSKSFDGIQKALHAHSENIPIMGVCFAGYNGDYQSLVTLIHSPAGGRPGAQRQRRLHSVEIIHGDEHRGPLHHKPD